MVMHKQAFCTEATCWDYDIYFLALCLGERRWTVFSCGFVTMKVYRFLCMELLYQTCRITDSSEKAEIMLTKIKGLINQNDIKLGFLLVESKGYCQLLDIMEGISVQIFCELFYMDCFCYYKILLQGWVHTFSTCLCCILFSIHNVT